MQCMDETCEMIVLYYLGFKTSNRFLGAAHKDEHGVYTRGP